MNKVYYCTLTYGDVYSIDEVIRPLAYRRDTNTKEYVVNDRICHDLVIKLQKLWQKIPLMEWNKWSGKTLSIKLTKKQLQKIESAIEKHVVDIKNDTGYKVDAREQSAFIGKYTELLVKIKKIIN